MANESTKRWRLLLYGDPKVGKTSLMETSVGPRVVLDAEGGTDWLESPTTEWLPHSPPPKGLGPNDTVIVHVTNWDDVTAVNAWLQVGDHEFKSLILDSLTEIQKQCKNAIAETGMRIQDWGTLYDSMDPVLREMRNLTKHPTNPLWTVVITALATVKDEKTVPDIQGAMTRSLAGQVDTIGYLQEGSLQPDGSTSREMVVTPTKRLYAGDRTKVIRRHFNGKVPIVLDDTTGEMEWDLSDLLRLLNGSA